MREQRLGSQQFCGNNYPVPKVNQMAGIIAGETPVGSGDIVLCSGDCSVIKFFLLGLVLSF